MAILDTSTEVDVFFYQQKGLLQGDAEASTGISISITGGRVVGGAKLSTTPGNPPSGC